MLGTPTSPAADAVLTMAPPPCPSIWRTSYFMHSHTPVTLTAIVRSKSFWVQAVVDLPLPSIPALLNAQSSRPYASTARPTIASTSAEFETSARTNVAAPPAAVTCSTVSWPPASVTSATTTLAPSRAKTSAAARPIPDPPPVTSATFPSTLPDMNRLLSYALRIRTDDVVR